MTARDVSALVDRLSAAIGPGRIDRLPAINVGGTAPTLRARPESIDELAACLRVAAETGAAVVPWGGGTQQRIGLPPRRRDLLLETGALPPIADWEPADLTASFGAGMTLAAVQARLAEAGQQLGIDAPLAERATLGGLAATNTTGPRRWLYGGWRDQVIGMQMVLAGGEVIKSGGRVVKNVQGYDLAKLFIGSLGTLGVITQLNLKTVPVAASRKLFCGRGELDSVAAFLDDVAGSQLRVSTVDLLDESCGRACGLDGQGWLGCILVEGARTSVDAALDRLRSLATSHDLRSEALASSVLEPVWRAWLDLGRTDDLGAGEALVSVTCLPSDLLHALRSVSGAAVAAGVSAQCWAHAGNGAVYARVSDLGPEPSASLARVQRNLLPSWPRTTLTAGDPASQHASEPWGAEPRGIALMRAIKRRFDPLETLQPGRFVGGI